MELRKIEIPDILLSIPQIAEIFKITDEYCSMLADDMMDVNSDINIDTSTEYGIERREKILHIVPDERDNIESRRARVLLEWTEIISHSPLTELWLRSKLDSLLGKGNYELNIDTKNEILNLHTYIDTFGLSNILDDWLEKVIPCNIIFNSHNDIRVITYGDIITGGALVYNDVLNISDDDIYNVSTGTNYYCGALLNDHERIYTSDDNTYNLSSDMSYKMSGAINLIETINLGGV